MPRRVSHGFDITICSPCAAIRGAIDSNDDGNGGASTLAHDEGPIAAGRIGFIGTMPGTRELRWMSLLRMSCYRHQPISGADFFVAGEDDDTAWPSSFKRAAFAGGLIAAANASTCGAASRDLEARKLITFADF